MPPLLVIDYHNGVPAYRQIMDQVKLQIATGMLPPGSEMASTRALSTELSLNPMTISKAYALLEHDGVLERRRGQTLVVRERTAPRRVWNASSRCGRSSPPPPRSRFSSRSPQLRKALQTFRKILDEETNERCHRHLCRAHGRSLSPRAESPNATESGRPQ